jgi:hypothetical protein
MTAYLRAMQDIDELKGLLKCKDDEIIALKAKIIDDNGCK